MINRKHVITLLALFAILVPHENHSECLLQSLFSDFRCDVLALAESLIDLDQQRYTIEYNAVRKLFGSEFREQFALSPMDSVCLSETVIDNRYYYLSASGSIYYYDGDTNDYVFLTTVPVPQTGMNYQGKGYSDLDEGSKQGRNNVVFQLIGAIDSKLLYGFCPTSGQVGVIDHEGIHWENTRLDNSIQMAGNESWPTPLMCPYIECDTLFAYYEPSWWSFDENTECKSELWMFNLQNGEFAAKALPETYGFTPYSSNQMLLLRRAVSGQLYLSVYDSYTSTILQENLVELPMHITSTNFASIASRISGIAFHEPSNSIVYAAADGVYQSINGDDFRQVEVNQQLWEELPFWGSAWIMQNGAYVFPNSDHYLVYVAD